MARDELRAVGDGKGGPEVSGLAHRARIQRRLKASSATLLSVRELREEASYALEQLEQRGHELRERLERATRAGALAKNDLFAILQKHESLFNHGIWMRLDPSETSAMLRRRTWRGKPLGTTLDPTPVAVAGNRLGFRWRFADSDAADAFAARHVGESELHHSVSVPTGGVFGEAVLGESNAAEKIDLSRFWNWKDALPPSSPVRTTGASCRSSSRWRARCSVPVGAGSSTRRSPAVP